jgi:hypothetical protein
VISRTNATSRPGTSQVGDARSPTEWDLNTTIAKNFDIGGGTKLQVRADLFSVLNKVNWGVPVTATNSSEFGRLTSASTTGSRALQLGARLTF